MQLLKEPIIRADMYRYVVQATRPRGFADCGQGMESRMERRLYNGCQCKSSGFWNEYRLLLVDDLDTFILFLDR